MDLRAVPACPKCGAEAVEAAHVAVGASYTCKFCNAVSIMDPPPVVVRHVVVQQEVIQRVVMVDPSSGKTSLTCPRCEKSLFEGEVSNATIHGCGACGGVWLDNAASSRVVQAGASNEALVRLADRATQARQSAVNQSSPVQCPHDKTQLTRAKVHGIEVDVCPAHGTWFDAGEVRLIAMSFQSARAFSAGGATHDYSADVAAEKDNRLYARGAMGVLGVLLEVTAAVLTTK